ncbi:polysaccharide biosynthesis tyrosine autokinase [Prosthecomicrobium sp. N25]|uniref:polysaccharide biosynthesis tyrosine autokinase n=1 Tax=Prosthecomicrobium sp. N25 TaxID=3129254 RepID=UPI0030783F98
MLTRTPSDGVIQFSNVSQHVAAASAPDIRQLVAMFVRQARIIIACGILFLGLGIAYATTAVPLYTASTTILIDSRKAGMAAQNAVEGALIFESGAIESQVQVLLSDKIVYAVVDKLKLYQNRELMLGETSPFKLFLDKVVRKVNVNALLGTEEPEADLGQMIRASIKDPNYPTGVLRMIAAAYVSKNVSAQRLGRTYVLYVSYTSTSPDLAAQIANEFAQQYLVDQLDSRFDATRRASVWLEDRIEELRAKWLEAANTVQQFKAKNNLVAASGRLINEQQLSEVNTQLIAARSETSRLQARYERLQQILDDKQPFASVTESLGSPVINELRVKYLQVSKQESEISSRLGANHLQASNMRKEMREYERLILDELGRLLENARSEYQIAADREKSLEASLKTAVSGNVADSAQMVRLGELERDAQTYQNLYQTYLARFQDAMQQQSFPVTEARIITPAAAPSLRSWPKTNLIVLASLMVGLGFGTGIGLLRELRDQGFRNGDQVRDILGLSFLGNLPLVPKTKAARPDARKPGATGVSSVNPIMNYTLDAPLTAFAETLRSVKVASDLSIARRSPVVIGVVSMFPGEGKTTVAKNMASLFATQGARTLLIDADLRNPDLTRNIAPQAHLGILDVLAGAVPLEQALIVEERSGLSFLPGATHRRVAHTSELLASPKMRAVLEHASAVYDYVILDLPPIGAVVDARAISPTIDRFLLVIEWGKTPKESTASTLALETGIAEKCLGVVLSKVAMKKLKRYDSFAGYMQDKKNAHNYYEQHES